MNANLVELVQNYHCKPLDQSIKLGHHWSLEFSLMTLSEEQVALESNKATTYNFITVIKFILTSCKVPHR